MSSKVAVSLLIPSSVEICVSWESMSWLLTGSSGFWFCSWATSSWRNWSCAMFPIPVVAIGLDSFSGGDVASGHHVEAVTSCLLKGGTGGGLRHLPGDVLVGLILVALPRVL